MKHSNNKTLATPRRRSLAEILQSIDNNARALQKSADAVTRTLDKIAPQKDGFTDEQTRRGIEAQEQRARENPQEWK